MLQFFIDEINYLVANLTLIFLSLDYKLKLYSCSLAACRRWKKNTISLFSVVAIMILGFGGSSFSPSMVVNAQDADKDVNPSMNKIMTSDTLLKILSINLVNYLNDSASILKITSMIPEVRNSEHADKINSSLHGNSQQLRY